MKNEKHSKFDFGENLLIKHKILENMRDDDVSLKSGLTFASRRGWSKYSQTQGSLAR
jgi:hypothetical protein